MKQILLTRSRRIWPLWLLISGIMLLAGQVFAQAPSTTINPTGGNTSTDGLQIIVTDTAFLVKKNGKWETNQNVSDPRYDRGLRTYVVIEPRLDAAVTPVPHYLQACQISPVKGSGTAGDPWKVVTTSYAPDQDGVQYLFQTIITYIQGEKYFLIDHVIVAPSGAHASYVHIYMSENSIIANDECSKGYAANYVSGYDLYRITENLPEIVGTYRDAGDCSGADAGAHVFKTSGGFTSYFAATSALRDEKTGNGYPLKDVTNGVEAEKGVAVHKAIYFTGSSIVDNKDEIRNKRFLIGFEHSDFSAVNITDPIFPIYEYPTFPLQIGFSSAAGSGDEGNTDHVPTGLKLRVNYGVSGIPIAVKVTATPSGANPATAADYQVLGSIVIPAGDYTLGAQEFDLDNIIIKGNSAIETNRTFTLSLSTDCAPYTTLSANSTATYTIIDDDAADIRLIPLDTTLDEGQATTIKIKMNGGVQPSPVVVTINRGLGNAENSDYLPAVFPFTVTIPVGSTEVSFPFSAAGDQVLESVTDSIELVATATLSGLPKTAKVFMKIVDTTGNNAANRVISLTANPALEGTSATITAALPAGITTEQPLTVRVGFAHVSTADEDFGATVTDSIDMVIPANGSSVTYSLPVANDDIIELEEELSIGGVLDGFVVNGSNLHVLDADYVAGMNITLSATPNPATEADLVTIKASLPGTLVADYDIVINLSTGVASTLSSIDDINYLEDYVIISKGEHEVTGNLEFYSDDLFEQTETLVLEGTATGFTIVPVTITVTDVESADPAARAFTITSSTYNYDEGQTAHVVIEISKMATEDITFTLSPGALTSASLDAAEYTMPSTVTILAGNTSVDFDVVFNTDAVVDGDKVLELVATGDFFGHSEVTKRSFNIHDITVNSGKNIIVTVDNTSVYEGADINFTFTLDGYTESTDTEITLSNTATGNAADDDDFAMPLPGSIIIPANQSGITLTLSTNFDWTYEYAEKLRLAFSAAGYTFNVASLSVDIYGDDSEPGTIPLEINFDNNNLNEGDGPATATVALPWGLVAGFDVPVTISRSATSQTGIADHSALPATVTIPKGSSSVDFTFSALADDSLEVAELLTIEAKSGTLVDITGDVYINDVNSLNSANTTLTIAPVSATINEGGSTLVWISLPAGVYTSADITVNIYAGPGTSGTLATSEYTLPSSVVLPAGANQVSFTVAAVDDGTTETPEQLQVVAEASVFGHNNSIFTNISIEDPAALPEIAVGVPAASVTEGNNIVYTFTLPGGYTSPSPITINLAKGTVTPAAADADFTSAIPATVTIPANAPGTTLTLSAKADLVVELLEKLQLTASATGYTFDNATIDLDVVDADYTTGMQITLDVTSSTVTEGGNSLLKASLPAGLTAGYDLDVVITKGSGSTAATADHSSLPATLHILAGSNASATSTITTNTDNILEVAETVVAEGALTGFTVQPATLTINDATSVPVANTKLTLTPALTSISEGGSTTVTLSLPTNIYTSTALVVTLTTGPGSSVGLTTADYTMPATATIPANGNSVNFTLDAETDSNIEGTETMDLLAQATVYGRAESDTKTITILDATSAPVIDVAVSDAAVDEGSATTIKFSLPSGYTTSVPIVISLAKGAVTPAAVDADFQAAVPATATIAAGSTFVDVVLTAKADQVVEQLEKLQLIPTATGYSFSGSTIDIDIVDGDYTTGMQITLAVTPASVTEGTSATVRASLPGTLVAGYDIDVAINKGAASTAGTSDHGALPATLRISAGSNASATSTITTAADDSLEVAETVIVQGTLSGFTVQPATLTINDATSADPLKTKITLTATATTIAEGASTTVTVALPTNVRTSDPLVVTLSSGTGTTMAASEYSFPATVTIPAGANSATFTVTANTDSDVESSETLVVKGDATVYGNTETASATITVTDATVVPDIDVTVSTASVNEGSATTIKFSLPTGFTSASPIVISLAKGGVTPAVVDADFQAAIPTTATIAAGASFVDVVLTAKADQVVEQLEKLQLIPTATGYTFSQTAIDIEVVDGDYTAGMQITLAVTPASVTEGTSATVRASLPGTLVAGYDMDVAINKGAASTAGTSDHGALPATLRISAGSNASATSTITTAADDSLEVAETVIVQGTLSGFTVQPATLTINDATSADPLKTKITLTATTTTIAEGASTTVTVALPTNVRTSAPIVVTLSSGTGTTMAASEYSFPATVTIPAGANSATFTVTANTDSDVESNETLVVKGDATVYGNTETASATITVTDATVVPDIDVTVSTASVNEGSATTIKFSLPTGFTSASPIVISLAKGVVTPAAVDADFQVAIPATATIAAGASFVDVVLTAKADQVVEQLEKLQLIPTATGYTFSQTAIDIEVVDGDYTAGMQITLAVTPASVTEGTSATVRASLPGTLVAGYDIDVVINKGAASTAATADHGALPATLRISAGSNASATSTITTATDDSLEVAETVIVQGTLSGFTVQPATLTINDATSTNPLKTKITLTATTTTIAEGASTTVTVALPTNVRTSAPLVVTLSSGTGTTMAASEYSFPATVTIPAGANSATFTVTANTDSNIEGNETLVVKGDATVYGSTETASATITVTDATATPAINVTVSAASVNEGSATTIKFSLPTGFTSASPIVISLAKGVVTPAAVDADFQAAIPTTATIAAGASFVDVVLTAKADQVVEQLEKLQLVPTATGYSFSGSTIDIDIVDGDYTTGMQITLAVTPASVTEGTSATVRASLPGTLVAGYDIDVAINKGAASTAATADHGALPATLRISAGSNASATSTITTAADDSLEVAETVIVQGTLSGFTVQPATLTINDATSADPLKTKITLTATTTTIAEGASTTVTVALPTNVRTSAPLVVTLSSGTGTTMAASEYSFPATVTIPAGANSATFTVTANTDSNIEGNETLVVKGDATVYGSTETASATITVTDATATPAINVTVSAASVNEGSATTIKFSLPTGFTSASPIVISLAKGVVTPAAVDADFQVAIPTTATIAAGASFVDVVLTAKADQVVEQLEKLRLIPTATGYTFSQSAVNIDVVDGDYTAGMQITLAVTPASVTEGTSATVRASLPGTLVAGYDIDIAINKGAASTVATADHGALPATLHISAGSNASATSTITTAADDSLEVAETVIVQGTLSGFTVQPATLTINDATSTNPLKTKITLTATTTTIAEGASTTVTVALPTNVRTSAPIVVTLSSGTGTTMAASEYGFPATVTIPAGANSATFTVTANTDSNIEGNETLVVKGNATVYGSAETGSVTITVTDATPAPVISVAVSAASVNEGAAATVKFSLPAGFTSTTPIVISLAKGAVTPAAVDADFQSAIPTTATIAAGASFVDVVLTAKADQVIEKTEKLKLVPTAAGYTFSGAANLDIVDGDYVAGMPITLTATPASVTEGASASVRAGLPGTLTAGYDIDVTISKGTASTAGTADHGALPATVRINAGSNASSAFTVLAAADDSLELAETVVVNSAISGFTVSPATITINDATSANPANKQLTITPDAAAIKEGTSTPVWISLPANIRTTSNITVALTRGSSSAASLATSEYNFPATVTLPAGANKVAFTVAATADDNILELAELLQLNLSASVYGTAATASTSVTIEDATSLVPANMQLAINIDSVTLHEGNTSKVTVQLPAGITTDHNIMVNLAAAAASTVSVADYSGLPVSVQINAGNNAVSFTIAAIQDNTEEDDETLVISGTSTGFTVTNGSVLIPGDEIPAYQVLAEKLTDAAEPSTNGRFRIKLSGGALPKKDVTVSFSYTGTASATHDYQAAVTATIPAGQNGVNIDVTVKDDQVVEVTESIVLTLQSAATIMNNKTVNVPVDNTPANMQLTDDENTDAASRKVTITKVTDAAEPGTTGRFTVQFVNSAITAAADVKVDYTVSGTATAGSDYTTLSGSVIIPAGANSANIDVFPINDALQEDPETVTVTLTAASSTLTGVTWEIGTPDAATLNIGDDDLLKMTLEVTETSVQEGAPIHYKLTSSAAVGADVPVTISLLHDNLRDYGVTGSTMTITIPNGASSVGFSINMHDNDINDEDGFVKLELQPYVTGPTPYYELGTATTVNTDVLDNDAVTIIFKQDSVKAMEGNSGTTPFAFTVQLNRRSSRDITLSYSFADAFEGEGVVMDKRRATAGQDFDASTISVVIPAMAYEHDIVVPVKGDETPEASEYFSVKLVKVETTSAQNVPTLGRWIKSTGVIINDDAFCLTCDTDGDGLTDGEEDINKNLDPTDDDTDNDGIPNYLDLDSDNDGVPDATERFTRDGRTTNDNKGDIRVHPALSPNGDGKGNEVMMIENINKYPRNEVVVMNRFGGIVYKSTKYDNNTNAFKGRSNTGMGSGNELPDGSYFYVVIVWDSNGKEYRTAGYVVLKR